MRWRWRRYMGRAKSVMPNRRDGWERGQRRYLYPWLEDAMYLTHSAAAVLTRCQMRNPIFIHRLGLHSLALCLRLM